ncbi:MAG: reverse transcriptase/maturase family protein [Patescibacteria group bacterium]
MKRQFTHTYDDIISLENFLDAWREFVRGKRHRKDVQQFELYLISNIILLHNDLKAKTYTHSSYEAFNISDPKPRNIHKASVRDRLLHHALYRKLYSFFGKTFVVDSYSCRLGKGTHKAMDRFREFAYRASENNTKTIWVLKCDIRKFFASVDQKVLTEVINSYILDKDIVWLISQIVDSFYSTEKGKGLPLGNLTSQLLVNIYMNEFDQFMKHKLKAKYYTRYADDFVILSQDKEYLKVILPKISNYLWERLRLQLHPDKVFIQTFASGVDFLGWLHFPYHRILRTVTRKRIFRMLERKQRNEETIQSYFGILKHGNCYRLTEKVRSYLGTQALGIKK